MARKPRDHRPWEDSLLGPVTLLVDMINIYNEPVIRFETSLPMMLYRALDAVLPPFRAIFSDFGITEGQWRVLRALWETDNMTLSELAPVTLTDSPALVGIVDRLERQGLVRRERSTDDRRLVHVAGADERVEV